LFQFLLLDRHQANSNRIFVKNLSQNLLESYSQRKNSQNYRRNGFVPTHQNLYLFLIRDLPFYFEKM